MAQYKYKARTMDGKPLSGTMSAGDEGEIQQKLHEQNAFLISAKELKSNKTRKQMKAKQLADFSRQLGTLVGAGVTLVRAMNIIADGEAVKPKEKLLYEDILRLLRQGVALSDAMEAANGAFPSLMIYMYRSAETSGNLEKVALQMAEHYEKSHRLEQKLSSSMTYPKILAFMIVAVVLIITKFVFPQFADLFAGMESLPTSTMILMGFSDFLTGYWWLLLIIVVALVVGWKALMLNGKARRLRDKFKLRMPLIGKLNQVIYTSRFARTLSSLYSAGVPIVSCLQIARKTIDNEYIDAQFDEVIPFVRAGNNLSDGLDMIDGFVRKLTDSIRVGEETGSLDNMLVSTADSMEYDADMAITKMVSYIEPCMLIIMGVIVAFMLVSVFSAMYGSYGSIAADV